MDPHWKTNTWFTSEDVPFWQNTFESGKGDLLTPKFEREKCLFFAPKEVCYPTNTAVGAIAMGPFGDTWKRLSRGREILPFQIRWPCEGPC